jgi:hypothetical protein
MVSGVAMVSTFASTPILFVKSDKGRVRGQPQFDVFGKLASMVRAPIFMRMGACRGAAYKRRAR